MRKKTSIFLIIVLFCIFAFAKKVVILPELPEVNYIAVDHSQIYISHLTDIYIYSKKNFKLVKKIGRSGEGPGEFIMMVMRIIPQNDRLFINSFGKISYWKKDGTFIKEIKPQGGILGSLSPIKDHFAGISMVGTQQKAKFTINIFDSKGKKIKEISNIGEFSQNSKISPFLNSQMWYQTSDQFIFVCGEDGIINLFDVSGKKHLSISYPFKTMKLKKKHRENYLNYMKTNPMTRGYYDVIQKMISFPDQFPKIRFFIVRNDHLYIFPHYRKGHDSEVYKFDLTGRLIKKASVPLADRHIAKYFPFDIFEDKIYQLVENEDKEVWELHIIDIR